MYINCKSNNKIIALFFIHVIRIIEACKIPLGSYMFSSHESSHSLICPDGPELICCFFFQSHIWRFMANSYFHEPPMHSLEMHIYRPQRSCGQGNVFTGVCLSTGGGGCLPQCMLGCQTPPDQADTPPDKADHPLGPGRHPPRKQTPAYGLRAADTHPTGMHSCLRYLFTSDGDWDEIYSRYVNQLYFRRSKYL